MLEMLCMSWFDGCTWQYALAYDKFLFNFMECDCGETTAVPVSNLRLLLLLYPGLMDVDGTTR